MAAAACGAVTAAGASPLDISYEEIPLEKIKAEDTLILSDSPEYARNYGILAEGTVLKGKGRIYYYHVNETGKPARLAVYGMSDKGEEIASGGTEPQLRAYGKDAFFQRSDG